MARLEAHNITKSYQGIKTIDEIELEVCDNEIVCLLGISGVGKSTLFNVLSGLLRPDGGQVLLDGEDVTGRVGLISYMQQKDLLLNHKKIIDNIALPLTLKGIRKEPAHAEVKKHLAQFGLEDAAYKYPAQLSGGMRQRAALLRTYLFSDRVALLDEPFSALDALTKAAMHKWYLEMMSDLKFSTLFITHDIDEAIMLSDRIYIMTGPPGRITCQIKVVEHRPRTAQFLATPAFINYKQQILRALSIE